MDQDILGNLVHETIYYFNPTFEGIRGHSYTYESVECAEGYEKPPKEKFEAKLQELIDAQPWKELREERNKRITETDFLATIDYPHASEGVKQTWMDYRQALRDLPANTENPSDPTWPQEPTD